MKPEIKVEGLRDTIRSLRQVDTEAPRAVRVANLEAAELVAGAARSLAGQAFQSRSGRAAGSIRALASQRDARVKAGGRDAPHLPWLDFGGAIRHEGHVHAVRPFQRSGRVMLPALRDKREQVVDSYQQRIDGVIRAAGLR